MATSFRRQLLSSVASALLALAPVAAFGTGCAAPIEEDTGEGGDAMTRARAGLEPMAKAAETLADRIAKRDPDVLVIPTPIELPSKAFTGWRIAVVVAGSQQGFMLLPRANAPTGSFGLLLADEKSQLVATAAFVPDAAPKAADAIAAILDGLPADAQAIGDPSSIRPKGFLSPAFFDAGAELVVKLLAVVRRGGASKALASSEAHLAAKVQSSTWRTFSGLVADRRIVAEYLSELVAIRKGLAGRKVVMVETSDVGGNLVNGSTVAFELEVKTARALTARFAGQGQKVALAVRAADDSAGVIRWALENDVPIVIGSRSNDAVSALRSLRPWDPETAKYLRDIVNDAKKMLLVRNVNTTKKILTFEEMEQVPSRLALIEYQDFAPMWAIADEGLALKLPALEGRFFDWLNSFQTVTTISL